MTGIEIAATAISTALSAVSAVRAGQAAGNASDYNAQNDRIQAGTAAMVGSAQEARMADQNARRLATARNVAGSNGVDVNSGSPLDVMADLAGQAALDGELQRWSTKNRVDAGLSQAAMEHTQAGIQRTGGLISGATTLLTGLGSIASTGLKAGYWGSSSGLSVPGGNAP
jgi:hypothetical protein